MNTSTTRIVGARIVTDGRVFEGDVRIRGQRIDAVDASLPGTSGETTIEAGGRLLLPGMIDDQVHFREPGFEHKGDIQTEARAALAGGITSYMEMPNCNPLTINQQALLDKHQRAARRSLANYAFYLGATNDNLEDVKRVDPALTCGIKVFMGASTGNMLVDNPDTLEGIFASTPLVIATHCEDTPTILANEAAARARYGEDVPFSQHPEIRSEQACWKSSSLAVELARRHGARLHVLHLTTAREMALFDAGPMEGKRITAEVCVHHLFFNDTWYAARGADIKCNPAIKRAEDQQALLKAVAEDRIDIIATDHAPHTREEKNRSYFGAPAGLPLVQFALPALLELSAAGHLTLPQVVQKASHAPAARFDVVDRGHIQPGMYADLVLVDDREPLVVDDVEILSRCGWTPFAGCVFRHRIASTWINGHLAWDGRRIVTDTPGLALEFDHPS